MEFNKCLNEYIKMINCSLKKLADLSELSTTVICRYRNGNRIPSINGTQIEKLANGIYLIAREKNLKLNKDDILFTLKKSLQTDGIDFNLFRDNMNELIFSLKISLVTLSRAINFDASYLSHIKAGKRKPADIEKFKNSICDFIVSHYDNNEDIDTICNLINCSLNDAKNKTILTNKLSEWLCYNTNKDENYIDDFLKKLDSFNLDEYIRLINFNKMKVPNIPFQFKTSKNYYGIENMKQGELDFLKSTVLSKSNNTVFMCSDMPMEDMAKDIEFGKKWMFGIAMMLKKGLHLNVIHNIDRPFNEMMLGLESWIPIYMTGQVSPYYLKEYRNNVYCHLNYVSGSFALTGECISGYHNKGKYYLTNNKDEVNFYKNKSDELLKKASPLIQIYRLESKDLYNNFILSSKDIKGNRREILSSLPIYTISNKLILKILDNNNVKNEKKKEIISFIKREKTIIDEITSHSKINIEILKLSKKEFDKYPIFFDLSGCFYNKKVAYTYEDYLEHLHLTKEFSNSNKNFQIKFNNNIAFRNIQIYILEKKYVVISKNGEPIIHFIIKHPKLCSAIEKFNAPIVEKI